MKLHQSIPPVEYKKAVYIHYFGYGFTYINVGLGVILLLLGIRQLLTGDITKHVYVFLLGGVFLLIRPVLYVRMIVKNVLGIRKDLVEFDFEVNEGRMEITAGETSYSGPVKDLHSYRDKKGFFLLYASKAQFFVLDQKQMSENEVSEINTILDSAGIKKR